MATVNIRITDENLLRELDRIVETEGYASRNQLINHILEIYVSARSQFASQALPSIVKNLCTDSIMQTIEISSQPLKTIVQLQSSIFNMLRDIAIVLGIEPP